MGSWHRVAHRISRPVARASMQSVSMPCENSNTSDPVTGLKSLRAERRAMIERRQEVADCTSPPKASATSCPRPFKGQLVCFRGVDLAAERGAPPPGAVPRWQFWAWKT